MVLFDDLQHPSMFPDGSGQHAPCNLKAAQAELSSQAPRLVVVTVATFRGSWQQDCDWPCASGQQSPTRPSPTQAVLSTQRIAPPCTLLMAFGFGTLTNTTPHNSTAPISSPAPSHLLLACGPRPCKTSMSSAPLAPRQVSWLSFLVLSISLVVICCWRAAASARAPDCSSQCSAGWEAGNASRGSPELLRAAKTRCRTSRISGVRALDALVGKKT